MLFLENFLNFDFSITNFLVINLLALLIFIYYISSNSNYLQESSFYFILALKMFEIFSKSVIWSRDSASIYPLRI